MTNFWLHMVLSMALSELTAYLSTADPKLVPIVTQLIADINNLLDALMPPAPPIPPTIPAPASTK